MKSRSIQALERAQGYLKFPDGRAMTGQSHDYKRHGTTTLFAALEIATGQITGRHYKRRRRVEFLDFMNRLVADYPDREIHLILDNLSTHKPKRDLWLARHPNVHAHYTPTHASWLNQIEIWFSILGGNSLAGASFHTVDELKAHIDSFIASYNDNARPFAWTKSKVRSSRAAHDAPDRARRQAIGGQQNDPSPVAHANLALRRTLQRLKHRPFLGGQGNRRRARDGSHPKLKS